MTDPTDTAVRLRKMIETDFEDGDRLPSEVKLSQNLGVSRAKLRESLGTLWQSGLIEKKWGVGTIVRKPSELPPVMVPINYIRSAPALIRDSGHKPSITDLSIKQAHADETISSLLSIPVGSVYWLVDRVFLADGIPIQRTIDAVRAVVGEVHFDASGFDVDTNTLVAMYEDQLGTKGLRSDGRLTVVPSPADTAMRLRLRDEHPVLLLEYSTELEQGKSLSYSVSWYNTAHVDVRFTAERPDVSGDTDEQMREIGARSLPAAVVSSHLSGLRHR